MNKAVQEGLKELARVAVIAAIPVLIASLEAGAINWPVIGVVVGVAVLKALDKFVHKSDVIEAKGVVPF